MLNPELNYTGHQERYENIIDRINTDLDFSLVLAQSGWAHGEDRLDYETTGLSIEFSVSRPFSENASKELARNAQIFW